MRASYEEEVTYMTTIEASYNEKVPCITTVEVLYLLMD